MLYIDNHWLGLLEPLIFINHYFGDGEPLHLIIIVQVTIDTYWNRHSHTHYTDIFFYNYCNHYYGCSILKSFIQHKQLYYECTIIILIIITNYFHNYIYIYTGCSRILCDIINWEVIRAYYCGIVRFDEQWANQNGD
jgi:hypothetical protein